MLSGKDISIYNFYWLNMLKKKFPLHLQDLDVHYPWKPVLLYL